MEIVPQESIIVDDTPFQIHVNNSYNSKDVYS